MISSMKAVESIAWTRVAYEQTVFKRRIGDDPVWAIRNLVPQLCYCKSADVTCHTEAEH
jgi:hypothetical protein